MPVRRSADPLFVQYVWDSIKAATQAKHMLDANRLVRSVQRLADCTLAQAELAVKQTLDDGFIATVRKSQKSGVSNEVESYRITKQEELETPLDDGHDWYCLECHLAGDVNLCRKCHRVFHEECSNNAGLSRTLFPKAVVRVPRLQTESEKPSLSENSSASANSSSNSVETSDKPPDLNTSTVRQSDDPNMYDESLCRICNLSVTDPGTGLDVDEFNYLLNFILKRIKTWVPEHLTTNVNATPKFEWHTPNEMSWRAGQLFYLHIDMAAVELKIRNRDYTNFSQFQGDVITMMHNIAIFHGVASQEFGAAEFMFKDMEYDIRELQNCVDCYRHSNEKINEKWFCLPCRKPHALVFAKQSGYPFWPAKIIKATNSNVDVRFFGGKYERAVLGKTCIKPITTALGQLHVKKTVGFKKAMEELKFHQQLLQNPTEVERIKAIVTNRPKSAKRLKQLKKLSDVTGSSTFTQLSSPSSSSTASLSLSLPILPSAKSALNDDVYEFHDSPSDANGKQKESTSRPATPGAPTRSVTPATIPVKRKLPSPEMEIVPENKVVKISAPPSPKLTPASVPLVNTTPAKIPREPDAIQTSKVTEEKENDTTLNMVSSSTELPRDEENGMQQLDQQYCDAVERMRRELEQTQSKQDTVIRAMNSMQGEIDRLQNEHNETLKRLFDAHNTQISDTKKKQWCFNCEQDAIYHCCWNTAYCSPTCQQQHWQAEHKKVCRRKR